MKLPRNLYVAGSKCHECGHYFAQPSKLCVLCGTHNIKDMRVRLTLHDPKLEGSDNGTLSLLDSLDAYHIDPNQPSKFPDSRPKPSPMKPLR